MSEEKFELDIPELDNFESASSESLIEKRPAVEAKEAIEIPAGDSRLKDPVFKLLADPVLPRRRMKDRAKLQLQSPYRVHFYWSMKSNPFKALSRSIGDQFGSYSLVVRFVNLSNGAEELFRVEPKGDWWFNVKPNNRYRAELGFYAPNRPFIRILFSNEITTPRKSPSPRTDYTTGFTTTSREFSQTLDAAGYRKDAFDVAMAGDEPQLATKATETVFSELADGKKFEFAEDFAAEIRFALLALASGHSVEDLDGRVRREVLRLIEQNIDLAEKERILASLGSSFDLVVENVEEFEEIGEAVFGLSVVNFPRRFRSRQVPKSLLPKLSEYENPELTAS